MRILKYKLEGFGVYEEIESFSVFQVLHVGYQGRNLMFWAKVDEESPKKTRLFIVYPTGATTGENEQYLGTVQIPETRFSIELVLHLHEVIK